MKINQKFLLKGMSCAACVNNITRAVSKVKGVKEVNVNLLTNSMVVTHEDVESDIIKAVKDIGYEAYLPSNKLEINKDSSLSIYLCTPSTAKSTGWHSTHSV